MYAPITWPIALGKRVLKSIIYEKADQGFLNQKNGGGGTLLHVKHLNTIKPKTEAYNVDILLAFILE